MANVSTKENEEEEETIVACQYHVAAQYLMAAAISQLSMSAWRNVEEILGESCQLMLKQCRRLAASVWPAITILFGWLAK
jgi:hypothetical protein